MIIRKWLTAAVLVAGLGALAGPAFATIVPAQYVYGSIDVNGVSSTHTSTSVTFTNPAGIDIVSGAFDELISSSSTATNICSGCITMGTPFSTSSTLPFQLFTGSNNGNTVALSVTSDMFTSLAGGGLQITGMGWVSLTGYKTTAASFSLTVPSSGAASFDVKTQVPEPSTLALFGAGLLGCAFFVGRRRRSNKTRA